MKAIALPLRWYPFSRGHWRIDRLLFKKMTGYAITRDAFANTYLVDLRNCIDRMIYIFKSYEKANLAGLIDISRKIHPDLFLDIGANIGVYCVTLARMTDVPSIHAFEPDRDNSLKLNTNIFLNKMSQRIVTHPEALSDKDGTAELLLARSADYLNMGKSSLVRQEGVEYESIEIPTATLDHLMSPSDKTILIKMDIEGHEASALVGMPSLLANNRVFMQIEIFPDNYAAVSGWLEQLGYRLATTQSPADHDYYFTNIEGI
jgi:FkbM family methyltransferase